MERRCRRVPAESIVLAFVCQSVCVSLISNSCTQLIYQGELLDALEVDNYMRYINLLTYLLTYLLTWPVHVSSHLYQGRYIVLSTSKAQNYDNNAFIIV